MRDFVQVDAKATISQLLGKLHEAHDRNALIFSGNKFEGIVRKIDLLRSRIQSTEMKVEHVIKRVPTINEESDMLRAAALMFQVNAAMLPVERDGKIVGVLDVLDVINDASCYEQMLKVRNIQLSGVVGVNENDKIGTIVQLMRELHVYDIPVFDNEEITGIISVSDVVDHYVRAYQLPERKGRVKSNPKAEGTMAQRVHILDMPVKSFATKGTPLSTVQEMTVLKAAQIMKENNVMSLLVMNNGRPIGLLTAKDVLRVISSFYNPHQYNIQVSGLKKLNLGAYQKEQFIHLLSHEMGKLTSVYGEHVALLVHMKGYKSNKPNEKYSLKMRLDIDGHQVTSAEADWDLITAVRENFDNLRHQIEHKTHEKSKNWTGKRRKY